MPPEGGTGAGHPASGTGPRRLDKQERGIEPVTWSRRSWLAGWLVVAIALVPVSLVSGQEDRGADDRPIPQDPARLKQKRAAGCPTTGG